MENFDKPEGQTTSDNFLKSEIEKDFLRAQSGWGELSVEDEKYLGKKGFETPSQLLKSYRELERAYSSKISLPKDGDKEAFDKLYSRLGMPEDTSGFDIEFADEDKEFGDSFKQACLENNILPEAAKGLYDWYVKNRSEQTGKCEEERINRSFMEMEEQKKAWGAKAYRNMELMKRGIRLIAGDDEEVIGGIEGALGTRRMMEVFARLGEAVSEDNPVGFGCGVKTGESFDPVEYFREMFHDY